VGHLGKLAVARNCQGKGLGELLLLDALARVVQAADLIGICAVEG
jgi:ribosomal protein S18 acetylase RimI-like enzyme